jgi:hypothetical protein
MATFLRPVIASYSGASYAAIRHFLDDEALRLVARVAQAPLVVAELDRASLDELTAMHVLAVEGGLVRLDTAVFLESDITPIVDAARRYGQELAARVAEAAAALRGQPPEVVNFLVGIVGIGQSLGHTLRDADVVVDWRNYSGKYAQAKVDFDEVCPTLTAFGPDLQNKTIQRGARYTAAFIGPGGEDYCLRASANDAPARQGYVHALNAFLTDAYAMLLTGQLDNRELQAAAEQAGLYRAGEPATSVVTRQALPRYLPVVRRVGEITQGYWADKMGALQRLLAATTAGRQGVPVPNMMMHLWRYLRRGVAQGLYAQGLFRDRVPEEGLITVFYENGTALDEMFN